MKVGTGPGWERAGSHWGWYSLIVSHSALLSTCVRHKGNPCFSDCAAAPTHDKINLESYKNKEQLCLSLLFSLFLLLVKTPLATDTINPHTINPSQFPSSSEPGDLSSSSCDRISGRLAPVCWRLSISAHPCLSFGFSPPTSLHSSRGCAQHSAQWLTDLQAASVKEARLCFRAYLEDIASGHQ